MTEYQGKFIRIPVRYEELDYIDPWSAFNAPKGDGTPDDRAEYQIAEWSDRVESAAIDISIWFSPLLVIFVAKLIGVSAGVKLVDAAFVAVALAVSAVLPSIVVWKTNGRPYGKRSRDLRIVAIDGEPITLRTAVVRQVLNLISSGTIFMSANIPRMRQDPAGRSFADGHSRTRVVYDI